MSHQHHDWRIGEQPPLIRAHSLAKHRVLRAYLERYVSVLTANPRQERFRLTLIDGFAGGGRYLDSRSKEERPGSPMIMLEAMNAAQKAASMKRSKPFYLDVKFIFVERSAEAIEYLRSVIKNSEFKKCLVGDAHLVRGEFVNQVDTIIQFVRQRGRAGRCIFVLDQFGYSEVPFPVLRKILSALPNSEIILTFATDFLIDYLSQNEPTQRILQGIGIHLPSNEIESAKQRRDWRRLIQFALHQEIPERTEARFYTPFFIRSADSHRDFWLVHLSGHYRARDVMVGLHWQESTSFAHYGRSGLRMLGYDQRQDDAWTKQQFLPGFFFDETAKASSQEELFEQLPKRLCDYEGGICFSELFASLTNETPVTAEIMRNVLSDLAREGVITVKDKSGATRRSRRIAKSSDVIVRSPQRLISF